MAQWRYETGLQQLTGGVYAYLQPDGSWGLNNTGLLVNQGESLMMDTTSDVPRTRRMLEAMAAAEPQAAVTIRHVILTHWHVDHVHGISAAELRGSRIHATRICADWMRNLPPQKWLAAIAELQGDARRQMDHSIGDKFDFSGLDYVAPTDVFEGDMELMVGARRVLVSEQRPAHTRSDSIIWVPEEGVAHTGDLISRGRHVGVQFPFMGNLIDSVRRVIAFGPQVVIPGHGPLMDLQDVRDVLEYLLFIQGEARRRYDAGLDAEQATDDILAGLHRTPYRSLGGAANLFFTIRMLFCEFAGDTTDHVRRNYPEYLATAWRLKSAVPQKYPELFRRL